MKSLEAVLKKREELKVQLEVQLEDARAIREGFRISDWSKMSDEEKKDYSRVMGKINTLNIQIDALTYVINYDSELLDIKKKQSGGLN